MDKTFLRKLSIVLEDNLDNENFGVSELAEEIGMSRSNLLRKVKSSTGVSASQYIRQFRLEKGMEILSKTDSTVSEVAFQVGFSSTSYFIKCFREHYGYPPGETGKRDEEEDIAASFGSHRLVAIMFTDIEGYTALMQKDEAMAVQYRARHREVFNSITKKYNGRILQYYGDGTLSTFASAIDAVRCGIDMQIAFQKEPSIPVRVGIHTGDIIVTDEDIIGDGVNVAARIEAQATAGSVFISAKVYDEIKNQKGINAVSMGLFELKNVEHPVEVYSVSHPALPGSQTHSSIDVDKHTDPRKSRSFAYKWLAIIPFAIIVAYLIYYSGMNLGPEKSRDTVTGKSIAVLPFINDSNDSSNIYIINGLMESILNNLQTIEDLRVVSRTSVEKFRGSDKTIAEIADELNVNYIVEGSGQKIGDQILLNIQLIEASADQHLWSNQYNRQATDIFSLQAEVAKSIASEISVFITPEEEKRIEKVYTENLEAYDKFLQGLDLLYSTDEADLMKSITHFKDAIALDDKFARAHAGVAIAYFFLDYGQVEQKYQEQINSYADQALLHDPELPQSLIAKALYYIQVQDYGQALPHLEKALKYNPNSALVINILADFYTSYIPNTGKYLEYALKGVQLDIAANDSASTSFIYLHVSNALVQSGFIDDAMQFIEKSIRFDPNNLYAEYVESYVELAQTRDLEKARDELVLTFRKDTTRLDVVQEVGKMHYFLKEYEASYAYYRPFVGIRDALKLDIYTSELVKIAFVSRQVGDSVLAQRLMAEYEPYALNDQGLYGDLSRAMLHAYNGQNDMAIESLRAFTDEDDFFYWAIFFLPLDPILEPVRSKPEYKQIFDDISERFWERHEELKTSLVDKQLL